MRHSGWPLPARPASLSLCGTPVAPGRLAVKGSPPAKHQIFAQRPGAVIHQIIVDNREWVRHRHSRGGDPPASDDDQPGVRSAACTSAPAARWAPTAGHPGWAAAARAPGQPEPPPGEEPAPTTEAPPPAPFERGSAGSVVPEDLLQAEQPTVTRPPTFLGPDLFNPPVHRGWITITPTFTLSGGYDDNIFDSDQNRKSDFIFGFIPGVTLSMQRPEYRLLAGYNVTSEIYAEESDLSGFANRQQLFADGFYLLSPHTRLTLYERFIYDVDTSNVSSDNIDTGRHNSLRNTAILGIQHALTERTILRASFSQTHNQFIGDTDARDSDTYRLLVGADHQFTARFQGTAEFESSYLDVQTEPGAFTEIPRLGFNYQFTQTLRGGLNAGPSFIILDNGETGIRPVVTARLAQIFSFGSLQAVYDYSQAAGSLGLSSRHAFFATLRVDRLVRNLFSRSLRALRSRISWTWTRAGPRPPATSTR